MKPSDFQKTVQCRFESCLKKVVRSVVKDYYKELNRRKNKEISFSELPDVLVDKMAVWDDYETDYTIFSVYRHLPTYEKIIRNLVSFLIKRQVLYRENGFLYLPITDGMDMILMRCMRMEKPRISIKRSWIILWKNMWIQNCIPTN